jgi:cytochrome oxidase assembly protein ShyY1
VHGRIRPRRAGPTWTTERTTSVSIGWRQHTARRADADGLGRDHPVNRGWVPREATAAISHPTGEQHFSGVLKRGEARNKYAHNDIEGGLYRWLDLSTIAKETASAPVLVVATTSPDDEAGGRRASYPRKRPLDACLNFSVEPSTHLVYAATWASLTVAGAFMTFKRFR